MKRKKERERKEGRKRKKKKEKKKEKGQVLTNLLVYLHMTIHFKLISCFPIHIGHNVTPPYLAYHITSFSKSNQVGLQTANFQGLRN